MLICKYSLYDDIKKSVVSKRQLSVVLLASLIAVSLVSMVLLGTPAFAQNQTDTDGKTIEQATITMNVMLRDGQCDLLEKFAAVSSTKCDTTKSDWQPLIITFPPENLRDMNDIDIMNLSFKPGSINDKMDFQLWLAYADHLGHQNKLAQRGDSPTQGPIIKNVQVYLNENECKFVDDLGIKESDFSCKNGIVLDVSASTLQKLFDLDFVTTLKIFVPYLAGSYGLPENIEPIISEQSPIAPTTIESDTSDYTSYFIVLIIIPVFVVITLFWRLRKKAKIEA